MRPQRSTRAQWKRTRSSTGDGPRHTTVTCPVPTPSVQCQQRSLAAPSQFSTCVSTCLGVHQRPTAHDKRRPQIGRYVANVVLHADSEAAVWVAVDTALINAHLIYKELHPDRAAISTQAFRAEVVDALIATAGVTLPPTINVSPPSLRAVGLPVVRGHKGDLAVVPHQHDLTVAGDANSRGDCALCGRKAMFKCTTCTGTHKEGLWFCISSERNCWGVVHKQ